MSKITDNDGKLISAGDTISFSYGIPPVRAYGTVADLNGTLWVYTPGHNPDRCKLKDLAGCVQAFWREKPRRSVSFTAQPTKDNTNAE